MKYKSAFIVSKLLPCTKGHLYLIDTALEKSEKVTLLMCSLKSEPIDGSIRYQWITEIYKDNPRINIIHCTEELPQYPEEHPNFWNIWVDVVHRYCPNDLDVIFSSEEYGEPFSKHLNIENYVVDLKKLVIPISGTKARTQPFKYWDYLPDVVKPYFVKRIVIMGPESVGKSNLTKKLASHYFTNFVIEYGRIVYEDNNNSISINDFVPISIGRQSLENWLIKSSNKLLFCDTEDLTTYIFSKMYFPDEYESIKGHFDTVLSMNNPYDLYILLKTDCIAKQDGTRNFLEEREDHYDVIKNEMINRGYNFVEIGGDWENRYQESLKVINKLIVSL